MADSRQSPGQERWLRFFNTVLYNALAPLYDSIDWLTFGAWWRLVSRALDYVPAGGHMLEVGFGPGKLHVALARRVDLLAGLDLARGMCRLTRQRLLRQKLIPRIVRGSVYALPYATGEFDCVVSTFAFSGFPESPVAMRELARILRPGGRLVLVDIGLPQDGNRAGTFWARLWERMGDRLYDQPAMMATAGLELLTFEEFGPGRHIRAVVGLKPGSPA